MPNIASILETAFRRAINAAFDLDADPLISVSQSDRFGDYQSNAAMGLAKQRKANPRSVASEIVAKLELGDMVAKEPEIAGPGFINIHLNPTWVARQINSIADDERLGISLAPSRERVVVDYSGPNVAKQMHVGHLRSTIIGDAIGRIVEFQGHEVIRQNHIGDWGTQFGMLIAFMKWTGLSHDAHIEDLEEFYRRAKQKFDAEPEFQHEARRTVVRLQGGSPQELATWKQIVDESRRHFQPIYQRLNVKLRPEDERGESFYNPMLSEIVSDLKQKQIAEESEGATVVFVEGFENPLIIEKSGGGYLYATTDLAAIRYRVHQLKARRLVYTHDSRQAQHFAQVFSVARRASYAEDASLEYAPFGTMLGEDGKPFRSREGELIRLSALLEEAEQRAYQLVTEKNPELPEEHRRNIARAVGIGAVKYSDLSKDRISDYVFSWDKMLSLDGNTAPYLQYAYARIRSIFRRSAGTLKGAAVTLESPFELALAKHALRLEEMIDATARELKPHHLCGYLYELATRFSGFYENCPVLQSEEPIRSSRLMLCDVTARTLALGLELLGIEHPEQM